MNFGLRNTRTDVGRRLRGLVCVVATWMAGTQVLAQEMLPARAIGNTPLTIGTVHEVASEVLGENRILNVCTPEGYDPVSPQSYPVLYVLDGSANEDLLHICGLVQFLTMIEVMPPTIVVGIANVDRKRDFTFPTTIAKDKTDFPTTGGSARFRTFLQQELIPYVQQQFHTSEHSTLLGQSLGGLLATEILLKQPAMFQNYIIVSPSLWWDDESLLKAAPQYLASQPNAERRVVVMVGNEGKRMEKDATALVATLKKKGPSKLNVDLISLPKENHATILHRAAYQGLEMIHARK